MRTTKDPAYPIRELISSQQPLGRNRFPLAMNPFELYSVEPQTLLGQKATHNPHPLAALLDPAVVFAEPTPDLFGYVPGSIVPDEPSCQELGAFQCTIGETGSLWNSRASRPQT